MDYESRQDSPSFQKSCEGFMKFDPVVFNAKRMVQHMQEEKLQKLIDKIRLQKKVGLLLKKSRS